MQSAAGIRFRRAAIFTVHDYLAPRRQYLIHLEGQVEIGLGDGLKHLFNVGDVGLAEDLTG